MSEEETTRTPGVGLEEEPPVGDLVRDRDGDIWRHVHNGWLLKNIWPGEAKPWTWQDLDETYGPLFQTRRQ